MFLVLELTQEINDCVSITMSPQKDYRSKIKTLPQTIRDLGVVKGGQ